MAEPKTRKTTASVKGFIAKVDPARRRDAQVVCEMMERLSGDVPAMWGPTIIGFGSHDFFGANGKSTPWPVVGFSPRKPSLVLYLMVAFPGKNELLAKLGKHTTGKSCLYIRRLADVDLPTLEKLVKKSIESVQSR